MHGAWAENRPLSCSFDNGVPLSKSKNDGSIGSATGSSSASWYGWDRVRHAVSLEWECTHTSKYGC